MEVPRNLAIGMTVREHSVGGLSLCARHHVHAAFVWVAHRVGLCLVAEEFALCSTDAIADASSDLGRFALGHIGRIGNQDFKAAFLDEVQPMCSGRLQAYLHQLEVAGRWSNDLGQIQSDVDVFQHCFRAGLDAGGALL